ncbi:MAG: integrase [Candidatus Kapaibacterium sp.]|nr:MAG: integrase [Candidatus Kapabacteria bacterium]
MCSFAVIFFAISPLVNFGKNLFYLIALLTMIEDVFPPVKLTNAQIQAHVEGFLKSIQHKRKETVGTYSRALQEFVVFFATDQHFEFRVKDVEWYRKHLAEEKKMKNASIATYMTSLRRLCQYLVEISVLTKNPAQRVQGGRRPTAHNRTFLSLDEVETLLKSIDTSTEAGLRDTALVRAMIGCSCSEVELANLDVGDMQQVGEHWYLLVQGKGRSIKDERIPAALSTITAIQAYIECRMNARPTNKTVPFVPSEPVFVSYSNRSFRQRMTVRGVRESINVHLKESGVQQNRLGKLTPFSLRHTSGILMAESGASVEELMTRMRIGWRPTAMLYFKQKGKLQSHKYTDALSLIAL